MRLKSIPLFLIMSLILSEPLDLLAKGNSFVPDSGKDRASFIGAEKGKWEEAFGDPCTENWTEKWFLDGKVGTVSHDQLGMTLTAGPTFKNDSHHMVLWTKDAFEGDLKIEYEYTRLDNENRCVNILYIQASGSGKEPFLEDISKWSELREVPSMKSYFNNMNLYHISYAAFSNDGISTSSYVRGRRYMPHQKGLKGTNMMPDYNYKQMFGTGVPHKVTVIKKDRELFLRIKNPKAVEYCHLRNSELPIISKGRVGLRHMFTRSARYRNFSISVRGEDDGENAPIKSLGDF